MTILRYTADIEIEATCDEEMFDAAEIRGIIQSELFEYGALIKSVVVTEKTNPITEKETQKNAKSNIPKIGS